jgi:hypothetical protein
MAARSYESAEKKNSLHIMLLHILRGMGRNFSWRGKRKREKMCSEEQFLLFFLCGEVQPQELPPFLANFLHNMSYMMMISVIYIF